MKAKWLLGAGVVWSVVFNGCTGAQVADGLGVAQIQSARVADKCDQIADWQNQIDSYESDTLGSFRHSSEIAVLRSKMKEKQAEILSEAKALRDQLKTLKTAAVILKNQGEEYASAGMAEHKFTLSGFASISGVAPGFQVGERESRDRAAMLKRGIALAAQKTKDIDAAYESASTFAAALDKWQLSLKSFFDAPLPKSEADIPAFKKAFGAIDRKAFRQMQMSAADLLFMGLDSDAEELGRFVDLLTNGAVPDVVVTANGEKGSFQVAFDANLTRSVLGDFAKGDLVAIDLPPGFSLSRPLDIAAQGGMKISVGGNVAGTGAIFISVAEAAPQGAVHIKTNQSINVGAGASAIGALRIEKTHSNARVIARVMTLRGAAAAK